MAEIWKPQSRVVYYEWITAITCEASDQLSDWENSFIASIDITLERFDLTESQADKLEQIYVKHTS